MAVNISACRYQIWICKPGENDDAGLDVTAACSGESGGYLSITEGSLGEEGLITVQGTLTLKANTPGIDEVLHPWQNPARFAPENRIEILVADRNGTLRLHPKSGLLIRKMPPPPCAKNNWLVKIELGCSLTVKNYRQPDEDASQVEANQSLDRGIIIRNLLNKVGLGFAGVVPEHPIAYPIPKTGGSFVQQAGAVAVGALYALYATPVDIRARRISLQPPTLLLKREVGTNEVDFEPLQGAETPCEKVSCVGVGYKITDVRKSGITRSEEFAPAETVQEGAGARKVLVGWTEETWKWNKNTFTRSTKRSVARGLLIPDGFFEELGIQPPNSAFAVVAADIRTQKSTYENGQEGRLVRKTEVSRQPLGSQLQDYYRNNPPEGQSIAWTGLITAEDKFSEYSYSSGSNTSRIEAYTNYPRGKIAGGADNWGDLANPRPTGLAAAEIEVQTWDETNEGEWRQHHTIQRSGQARTGSVAAQLGLATVLNETTFSNAGQNQPPAAERRQRDYNREEVQYEGEAHFQFTVLPPVNERQHTYRIDYATSEQQCDDFAKTFGSMRIYRSQGFRISTDFDDAWFNYLPLSRIDVTENGVTYLGITDGVTWTFAADQAVVVADCMRIGKYGSPTLPIAPPLPGQPSIPPAPSPSPSPGPTPEPVIVAPFITRIVLNGASGQQGEFRAYPYELDLAPITLEGGSGTGGDMSIVLPTVTLDGGSGRGGVIVQKPQHLRIFGGSGQGGSIEVVAGGLSTSLSAAYRFNGDTTDAIASNNLTVNGTESYDAGKVSQGFLFDGSTYLSHASAMAFEMGEIDYTISLIFRWEGAGTLVGKFTDPFDNEPEYLIQTQSNEGAIALLYQIFNTAISLNLGSEFDIFGQFFQAVAWHSVTTDEVGLWVKNYDTGFEQFSTAPRISQAVSNTTDFRVGGNVINVGTGTVIDALHIWKDRVLSEADRNALFNDGNGAEYPF